MRQLQTFVLVNGSVRHLVVAGAGRSLCSMRLAGRKGVVVDDDRRVKGSYSLCEKCAKARDRHDADMILPTPNPKTMSRVDQIGSIQLIDAQVFRVRGKTDTYTVTIPSDPRLATLCNCMAGKTRPETECKHRAAIRLSKNGAA